MLHQARVVCSVFRVRDQVSSRNIAISLNDQRSKRVMAFYEKVIKLRPEKLLDMTV